MPAYPGKPPRAGVITGLTGRLYSEPRMFEYAALFEPTDAISISKFARGLRYWLPLQSAEVRMQGQERHLRLRPSL